MSDISAAARREAASHGDAMAGGRFPIRNKTDLANAIRAVGRAPASDRPAVRRFIISRAKALGASYPSTWNDDGSLKTA